MMQESEKRQPLLRPSKIKMLVWILQKFSNLYQNPPLFTILSYRCSKLRTICPDGSNYKGLKRALISHPLFDALNLRAPYSTFVQVNKAFAYSFSA